VGGIKKKIAVFAFSKKVYLLIYFIVLTLYPYERRILSNRN